MFARLILTTVGLACASAAALLFLPFAVLVDPLVQSTASPAPTDHWFGILERLFWDDDPQEALATFVQLIWTIGMLVCVVPVTIAALVGGLTRTRSFVFFAGLTGTQGQPLRGPWRPDLRGRRASHPHSVPDRRCRRNDLLGDCRARREKAPARWLDVGSAQGIGECHGLMAVMALSCGCRPETS